MKRMLLALVAVCTLASCEAAKEKDDLARAQKCLDEVPQSNPLAAEACLQYVAKYDSQQATILKCSIYMTAGGLMEDKVVKAWQIKDNNTITNKEAAYLSILSLNNPTTDGYDHSKTADAFCQRTGVPGLRYISGLVVTGTYLARVAALVPGGGTIDMNDPAAVNTVVNNLIAQCTNPTPDNACTEDLNTIGQTVANLASSYCANTTDNEVCNDVEEALEQAQGNAAYAGQALICFLGNKTFNPTTGTCNP